ncbi:MAG: hydrolase TatD [Chlamydiae bacterium RIFCSPHIGHO2_12_FULL_44_59]|nr:MAG: hydrolase TatD [Chlamydiae bacterium RIFCSPHIGHO2_01_FULL_44_39]OGN58035.1 MAG: hydrolase TatD [Chlamydiae bacterium RIFCSPHIGHO2_02_FULL_45_9]OGN61200.1 MAG: hydrolase TatD [Chlamydiae bacterium RIFCSPHIGHO2_12_FULL_44_59]OGN65670.1 MAG: hydrolase TatD [Chlamydiae bacterium RIFCSPLOWO2_01_FULL_44_52]OGN68147.1 MAG: hydrolase TatD [Chlamydiae bacterium RIFCSPLOWO2_02_FULL_45_22]OGN69035.1 MAG: hydrolase TatD [Chlamydiae bacterium RIFCSPLOWO2_12_FULL_45_20]
MNLFDSHAHLSSAAVLPEIAVIMERARKAHVTNILNICTDPKTLEEGLALEMRFSEIKNAGATPPHDVEEEGEEAFFIFQKAVEENKLVAVGETGLDYHYQNLDREVQKRFFIRYLHLAAHFRLPVIFHCREAFLDLFAIADQEYPKGAPAILHCFTGSLEEAEKVLHRGWHLSLSGIVTFKKSEELREVAKIVPLNQLLVETDTPYLAPQGYRGKQNEPAFLQETLLCIADMKGLSMEEVTANTHRNASSLFGLKNC